MRSAARLALVCVPITVAAIAVAVIAVLAVPVLAVEGSPPASAPVTPTCAWTEFSAGTINEAAPDSSATYWVLQYTVQDGLRIVLHGQYPLSRYASLEAYKTGGGLFTTDGVSSSITDYAIQPDRGSVNPFQPQARGDGRRGDASHLPRRAGRAGDTFTVTLQSDVSPGESNTLPLAPAGTPTGTTGTLIYRVYLPAHGVPRVQLPTVTFELGGQSVRVAQCAHDELALPSRTPTAPAPATDASAPAARQGITPLPFARAVGSSGGFPNADSGYLSARLTPPGNDDVVVIRGKAPTFAAGEHPRPWPAAGTDLRYWSFCDYLASGSVPLVVNERPDGTIDYGCRNDSEVKLDRRGYYTVIVGTEEQRAAIDRIRGATFLPFSTTQATTEHALLLRNMLANPNFAQAVQNVPQDANPASAKQVMGRYYPLAAICPLSTLATAGARTCLAASS